MEANWEGTKGQACGVEEGLETVAEPETRVEQGTRVVVETRAEPAARAK